MTALTPNHKLFSSIRLNTTQKNSKRYLTLQVSSFLEGVGFEDLTEGWFINSDGLLSFLDGFDDGAIYSAMTDIKIVESDLDSPSLKIRTSKSGVPYISGTVPLTIDGVRNNYEVVFFVHKRLKEYLESFEELHRVNEVILTDFTPRKPAA